MSFIGKFHEIALYAFLTSIVLLVLGKGTLYFVLITFVPFIIIALIGALVTKYYDKGEGLTFESDKILVIMFSHIAEEILGLILTPVWFIKDLIKKSFNGWKIFDYITYTIEIMIMLAVILI